MSIVQTNETLNHNQESPIIWTSSTYDSRYDFDTTIAYIKFPVLHFRVKLKIQIISSFEV